MSLGRKNGLMWRQQQQQQQQQQQHAPYIFSIRWRNVKEYQGILLLSSRQLRPGSKNKRAQKLAWILYGAYCWFFGHVFGTHARTYAIRMAGEGTEWQIAPAGCTILLTSNNEPAGNDEPQIACVDVCSLIKGRSAMPCFARCSAPGPIWRGSWRHVYNVGT